MVLNPLNSRWWNEIKKYWFLRKEGNWRIREKPLKDTRAPTRKSILLWYLRFRNRFWFSIAKRTISPQRHPRSPKKTRIMLAPEEWFPRKKLSQETPVKYIWLPTGRREKKFNQNGFEIKRSYKLNTITWFPSRDTVL